MKIYAIIDNNRNLIDRLQIEGLPVAEHETAIPTDEVDLHAYPPFNETIIHGQSELIANIPSIIRYK